MSVNSYSAVCYGARLTSTVTSMEPKLNFEMTAYWWSFNPIILKIIYYIRFHCDSAFVSYNAVETEFKEKGVNIMLTLT